MSVSGDRTDKHMDPEETRQQWQALMEQSQRIVKAFVEKQISDDEFSIVDAESVGRAFCDMYNQLWSHPEKLARAQMDLWVNSLKLWTHTAERLAGKSSEAVVSAAPGDRRFRDSSWTDELTFDYLKQSYLLSSQWLQTLVQDVEGMDPKNKGKVDFYTRQFINTLSPSNFASTNPAVLKKARESGGKNLLDGLKNLLDDMEKGRGELKISMTDMEAFALGKNVATSSGKVVYQNDLMQLIQYAPGTDLVYRRPLLIVPPWINKFYILDLQARNSLIKFAVDQGHTVFVISWVNPSKELAHKDFEDYMIDGPLAAIDAITAATGEPDINILGFCIGGILTEALLAWMHEKGDTRVKSATLLTTLLDFKEVGEVSVFVDDEMMQSLEAHIHEKGYLEGKHMARMFSMMRENDLIWSFVVNNYLMGREPMPFDLLYWNADSTRLPATMLLFYLKKIYLENGLLKPGYLQLDGIDIDVSKIRIPVYSLATKDDHIAPWVSCYPVTQTFAGPVRFVLGASGHIAGVVNPPSASKYAYWINNQYPENPQEWLAGAKEHAGSWWTDWKNWLARRGGKKVPARIPGDGNLSVIEDAPGSYVKVRAPD